MRCNTKWLTTLVYMLTVSTCNCKSTHGIEDNNEIPDELNAHSDMDITSEKLNHNVTAKISTSDKSDSESKFEEKNKRGYKGISTSERGEAMSTAQLNAENVDNHHGLILVFWGKHEQPNESNTEWTDGDSNTKRYLKAIKESFSIDDSELFNNKRDKRKWQDFSTWGKGNVDNSLEENSNRGWSRFTSWGKRDHETDLDGVENQNWKQFISWGKRNSEQQINEADKRKMVKVLQLGKSLYEPILNELDKRKLDKFISWLKVFKTNNDLEAAKRKWAKFSSRGKHVNERGNERAKAIPYEKKWNQLAVWGKKRDMKETVAKRSWPKISSWEQRSTNPKVWFPLNTWGKRQQTGLRT